MNKTKAKKKAWAMFSKYIRLRDGKKWYGDKAACITCGKVLPVEGRGCLQAGHFIPGRNNGILFDERGVHAQCYGCNVHGRGQQPRYHKFMLEEYGQEVIDELYDLARSTVQYKAHDYLEIAEKYKKKIDELKD